MKNTKRIAFRILMVGIVAGLSGAPVSSGFAQGAQSPYDTIYRVLADTTLRSAPEPGAATKASLSKGTQGVVMRWCRDEFSFRDWAYGSLSKRRAMLQSRVCEVEANGTIGFVDAKYLDPM